MAHIPVGTLVHNVELKPGKGGQLARSAGTYVQLVGRDRGYAILRLTSGEVRLVRGECMASIGAVSNPDQQNIKIGKAGRSRWLGRRPHVRGVVMNPVDHPHGGGEGRTSGGRHPVTPWGKPTKGKRTRSNKKTDRLIVRRRKPRVILNHGTFSLERPVCRWASVEESGQGPRIWSKRSDQNMVSAVNHNAAICWTYIRCA